MNKIIKDVLEERAAHVQAPHFDAARLIRSGRRRRIARRGIAVLAVVAAAMNPAPGLVWADADHIYYGNDQISRPGGYFDLTSHGDSVLFSTWDNSSDEEGSTGRGTIFEWQPSKG